MVGAAGPELLTERLVLRRWRAEDVDAVAAMNADPIVMEFFPSTMTREESAASVQRSDAAFDDLGFGLWAVEVPGEAPCIGFVGLAVPRFETAFTPCVEIGWRLAAQFWGRGYAPEAARAALSFGFTVAGLDEIISFTTVRNERSQRVMRKIGMERDPDGDFDHPYTPGWDGRRHVLYRLTKRQWEYGLQP